MTFEELIKYTGLQADCQREQMQARWTPKSFYEQLGPMPTDKKVVMIKITEGVTVNGHALTDAITALHAQRRSDGRPNRYELD